MHLQRYGCCSTSALPCALQPPLSVLRMLCSLLQGARALQASGCAECRHASHVRMVFMRGQSAGVRRYEEQLEAFARKHTEGVREGLRTPLGLVVMSESGSLARAAGVAAILALYARCLRRRGCAGHAEELLLLAERQVRPCMHPQHACALSRHQSAF
jgi:hypothetical protein